jgi:hypothetical protein
MDKSEFFLIVIDEDRKLFTVEGPVADDQTWNSAVVAAQQAGRRIRCCNIGSTSRADAIAEWQRHYGRHYRLMREGRVVSPEWRPAVKREAEEDWGSRES